ncbi:hypothetical protein SCLCIDRAFT_732182 [Scleroderma citrinum Foug A]|uniref:Uncharacterized protein n=1 Tax=Scleroderma citrinum Foug A TaxID=1036808 RepID=A0A0C3E6J9_9AGAM|nr:hypothetical protein SCLCIDRAFT_732182 [Scleroderma citrinum Foug A]
MRRVSCIEQRVFDISTGYASDSTRTTNLQTMPICFRAFAFESMSYLDSFDDIAMVPILAIHSWHGCSGPYRCSKTQRKDSQATSIGVRYSLLFHLLLPWSSSACGSN